MDSEQISDSLRNDKIIYTGIGLAVIAGLVLGLEAGSESLLGGDEVEVTLNIDDGDWSTENMVVENNSTVLGVLNTSHQVEYTEYDMGAFVTSIDGTGGQEDYSWLYFVNGESASSAVDRNYVSEGDNITFRYLHSNETSQYLN